MKVIHIDSGLGNQMLGFCEYLAIKKMNPNDDCYIETIVYDIPDCGMSISQWNGFELERVFGIKAPNIKDAMSISQFELLKEYIRESEFWKKNWNFSPYFIESFNKIGIRFYNNCRLVNEKSCDNQNKLKYLLKMNGIDAIKYYVGLLQQRLFTQDYLNKYDDRINTFITTDENVLSGQRFSFIHKNNGIENIECEIRDSFTFPEIVDKKNLEIKNLIENVNSIAIHVRRGDMLNRTHVYYTNGYFKRSVLFLKNKISDPVFVFFCDPDSIPWCKLNLKLFGLSETLDKIYFVDWNLKNESFRDMQLMSYCKHNIVTNSSFGWWGAFLNMNPCKITCSPDLSYNTTHHF